MVYLRNNQFVPPPITQTGVFVTPCPTAGHNEPAPALVSTHPQPQPSYPAPQPTAAPPAVHVTSALNNNQPPTPSPTNINISAAADNDPSSPISMATIGGKSRLTTVPVQTTVTTSGVFTTDVTTTLSNGVVTMTAVTSFGTRTFTTTTEVPTEIGVLSARTGPPGALIGGVIGATVVLILALIAFFILRRRRKQFHTYQTTVSPRPSILTETTQEVLEINPRSPALRTSLTRPRPFLGFEPSQPISNPELRAKEKSQLPVPSLQQEDQNPFRDPEVAGIPEAHDGEDGGVEGARDALDRLQQLTSQLEAELHQLNHLARLGQLSDEDRVRLEEIRRTTGLTMPFDPRRGHLSTGSSASGFSVPPSYHSHYSS